VAGTGAWKHDASQRQWLPVTDGPWLVVASSRGVRIFSLLSLQVASSQLIEVLGEGWFCPDGEILVAPPVFTDPGSSPDLGERWAYWLTRTHAGELHLYGIGLTLTKPLSDPLKWELKVARSPNQRSAGLASVRAVRGVQGLRVLVLASGQSLATFEPPKKAGRLSFLHQVETKYDWDIGHTFSDTNRLILLPPSDGNWLRRYGAVGVLSGLNDRRFVRFSLQVNGIRISEVQGTGHPVGVADLPEGYCWVYFNEVRLGHVNTMDQTTLSRELQQADRFDRVRVAGRIVALSGQNDMGRPILRVFDLLSRTTYHSDDWSHAGSLFPLPAILGPALFTIDRDDRDQLALTRHWLVPSPLSGVRT
jgi:hypothetical protein